MSTFLSEEGPSLAVMAGLLVFSGFFSGAETALFSLSRDELAELVRQRPRRGGAARRLIAVPDAFLVSVLFGNLVANTLYFSIAAVITSRQTAAHGAAAGAAVSVVALLCLVILGEVLPKAVAAASPRAVSSWSSVPLLAFHVAVGRPAGVVASPILQAVRALARRRKVQRIEPEELRMLVELASSSGALSGPEAEMIDSVVELSELRVREVMVPRVDLVCASVDDRPELVLRRLRSETRSRAPVYDGPRDNIIGVVEARELVAGCGQSTGAHRDLRPFVRPVVFVPESARVSSVLEMVRSTNLEVAIAVDEYGGTAGLITLEDLAEAVFGQIADEAASHEGPEIEKTERGSYVLSGDLSVRDWAELFGVVPEEGQFDTLGGFVTYLMGRIPQNGDEVTWQNLRFVVRAVRRGRLRRVELSIAEPSGPPDGAAAGEAS